MSLKNVTNKLFVGGAMEASRGNLLTTKKELAEADFRRMNSLHVKTENQRIFLK